MGKMEMRSKADVESDSQSDIPKIHPFTKRILRLIHKSYDESILIHQTPRNPRRATPVQRQF